MIIQIIFIWTMFVCIINLITFTCKIEFPKFLLLIDFDTHVVMYPAWIFQVWFWSDLYLF